MYHWVFNAGKSTSNDNTFEKKKKLNGGQLSISSLPRGVYSTVTFKEGFQVNKKGEGNDFKISEEYTPLSLPKTSI